LGSRLKGNLKNEVFAKITQTINNSRESSNPNHAKDNNDKTKNYLRKQLKSTGSKDKTIFYLKILSRLEEPQFYLIISKLNYYNLKGQFIGKELKMVDRKIEDRSIITGELLYYLRSENYKIKQRTAEILSAYKDPLTLIPIKNIIKSRKELAVDKYTLYFALDILADFAPYIIADFEEDAADFSELFKELIREEDDDWLKYHALKAYLQIGVNDKDYDEFITKVRESEKEPVLLALKDEI